MSGIDISSLSGITLDSRKVKPGYLFAALPGSKVDGRDFIDAAVKAGAKTVLAPNGTRVPEGVTLIADKNPKKKLANILSEYYKSQPCRIVAITGTNGKTSTAYFCEQIWNLMGYNSASLGTLGVHVSGVNYSPKIAASMTTPDPVSLHEELSHLQEAGIEHLAMEASSHGLHQYRLDGAHVKAAGFTSFSRDHLDYHPSVEDYFAAKMRLFEEVTEDGGIAVLNADIAEYEDMKKAVQRLKIWSYGECGEHFKIKSIQSVSHGQKVVLEVFDKTYDILLPLVGRFQVYNALCALGLVLSEDGSQVDLALEALEKLKSVPGRLQLVDGHPQKAGVYVDYAHTPDAIETVLKALRPHTQGKLVCIFGCGGDRDAGKRPLMGKAAIDNADIAIVTDDNPRSEDPASIRAQAASVSDEIINVSGRREAIKYALSLLEEGDVLAITGKGHEQGQQFADHTEDFCDAIETKKLIEELR